MAIFFVTRHAGAVAWARRKGIAAAHLDHLDPARVAAGDVVIGTLPVHLAAEVCRRGARYFHLVLDLPPGERGRSLDADALERYGARLEEYRVESVGSNAAEGSSS